MSQQTQLVEAHPHEIEAVVAKLGEVFGISTSGNPDVRVHVFEKLRVADVRELRPQIFQVPVTGTQLVVIAAEKFEIEAQQALLKVTEEPPENTVLALVTPSKDVLLPTLRSRCVVFNFSQGQGSTEEAMAFLAENIPAREKRIEAIHKAKDQSRAQALLIGVEVYVAKRIQEGAHELAPIGHELAILRQDIGRRGVSVKMILGHVAARVPVYT